MSIQGVGRAKIDARKAMVTFEIVGFVFSQEVAIVPPEYQDAERIPLLKACLGNIEAEASRNLTQAEVKMVTRELSTRRQKENDLAKRNRRKVQSRS